MAFERPTLATLVARFRGDWKSRADIGDAWLRRAVEGILAIAVPGLTHGLHGHLAWIAKQVIFDTADIEQVLRWARIFGLSRKDPTKSLLVLTFTGSNGSVFPTSRTAQLVSGVRYVSTIGGTVADGSVSVTVEAETAGLVDVQAGAAITLTSTISGITSTGVVTTVTDRGTNLETRDELLARLLQRIRTPPRGGGPGDYVSWALEVAGVTRAWEYANMNGLGTVGLAFVLDGETVSIVPDSPKIDEVQAYVDARKPITATLDVFALTENPLNPHLSISPDTSATRLAAEAELKELLVREASPGGTILISHIRAALSAATGENDYTLTSPTSNFESDPDEIAVLGSITWV